MIIGRQHRKDIDLYLNPFRGNNNIINLNTTYEKNVQLSSNKYKLLLLLLLLYIYIIYIIYIRIVVGTTIIMYILYLVTNTSK